MAIILIVTFLILGILIWIALTHGKPSEQNFVTKNYEKLVYYQEKIKPLSIVVNDKYSELSDKLKCAEKAVSYYEELKSFCFQSDSGMQWYLSACKSAEDSSREAVSDFKKDLAILEERKHKLAEIFKKGDWSTYWNDEIHDLEGQGARITRSYEEKISVEAYNPAARLALIRGASGNHYFTNLHFCSCPDFKKRELPCKHIYCLCRLTADPDFSAPLKIPTGGLHGMTACVTGKFNFGTQETVRIVLKQYLATVASNMQTADVILEGQKAITLRSIEQATKLKLMQINEDDLFPMLNLPSESNRQQTSD